VEKEDIAGDIGQIKGCIESIKKNQDRVTLEMSGIYDRLSALEKAGATREQRIADMEKRFDQQREDAEREKDREISRANVKLAIVAIVVTVISTTISTVLYVVFGV
jgi:chromosome segregation ATPase